MAAGARVGRAWIHRRLNSSNQNGPAGWLVRFDWSSGSLRLVAVDFLEQARLLGRRLVLLVAAARSVGLLRLAGLQAPHKAIDLAGGVDDPLLAGVERVAVRADIDAQILLGRMCGPAGAARRADDSGLEIFG